MNRTVTRALTIRPPAVAGQFYPADPDDLRRLVELLLQQATVHDSHRRPKALLVPHAGYAYSGPIAASGYAQLRAVADVIRRVVLLGPTHRVAFPGLALPSVDAFATPLGNVLVDPDAVDIVQGLSQVLELDEPHRLEHSLEVQLPFLQCVLKHFMIVPLCVGIATSTDVAEVLQKLWDGPETLIVVSSDLSHYHNYETASEMDQQTTKILEECRWRDLCGERACGYLGAGGLLQLVRACGRKVHTLDLRNSGDTAGRRDKVVGYGAYVIF